MRPVNIRDYLEILKREGELHVIDLPVNPYLELAEIQKRVVSQQGPALLSTPVKSTAGLLLQIYRKAHLALNFGGHPSLTTLEPQNRD
jgi:UbiD family decarboxylase